jgi:hypothetical protein
VLSVLRAPSLQKEIVHFRRISFFVGANYEYYHRIDDIELNRSAEKLINDPSN